MRRCTLTIAVGMCLLFCAFVLEGCGGHSAAPTAPTPPQDPTLQVTPGESNGPIRITFVDANISAGSTITGCGPRIEGCVGRLRMRFRLDPPSDGPALYARLYLHATNLVACLQGEIAPFTVRAGVPLTIDITADRADNCRTPTDIATMAFGVEGPIQVSSRQTWSVHYVFAP